MDFVPISPLVEKVSITCDDPGNWEPKARDEKDEMEDDTLLPLVIFKKLDPGPSKSSDHSKPQAEHQHLEHEDTNISERLERTSEFSNSWESNAGIGPVMERFFPNEPARRSYEAAKRSPEGLMAQLQKIQKHRISRSDIIAFADNLRFLTGERSSDDKLQEPDRVQDYFNCSCRWDQRPASDVPVTPCSCRSASRPLDPASNTFSLIRVGGCRHYVAISYRWQKDWDKEHTIITGDGERLAKAPSRVLLRAAAFARHHKYQLLWCDQECITDDDRSNGIQAMDIVYERAAVCLAPLEVEIIQQEQLDALAIATLPAPFPKWEEWIEWVEGKEWTELLAIAEVVKTIFGDAWFSRSWIFQESTAAYATMLLIKYNKELDLTKWAHLGSLPGEIQVPLCTFRLVVSKLQKTFSDFQLKTAWYQQEAATLRSRRAQSNAYGWMHTGTAFGMRHLQEESVLVKSDQLRSRSSEYEAWKKFFGDAIFHTLAQVVHGKRFTCSALQACQRLAKRTNSRVSDRLAILSNLCHFDIRLDSRKLTRLGYDLSSCFLCTAILNGDLSLVRPEDGIRYGDLGLNEWDLTLLRRSRGPAVDRAIVDLQSGPPMFSWAPRLVEGFTESRHKLRPGGFLRFPPQKFYISFQGTQDLLHIEGFLWEHHRRLEIPGLAKRFYRRRFEHDEWNRRPEKLELPDSLCDIDNCCKISNSSKLMECFGDLIQLLDEEGYRDLAQSLRASLLILLPRESNDNSIDIGSITLEEFSSRLQRDNYHIEYWPQFFILQKIIHDCHVDIWSLSRGAWKDAGKPGESYAIFPAAEKVPIFTPRRTSPSLGDEQEEEFQWWHLSWPAHFNDDTKVVSIETSEANPGPLRGFWSIKMRDAAPHAFY